MQKDKAASLLGLATKAGKTVGGGDTVLQYVRARRAFAVIVSCEASDRTKKTFKDKCSYYHIPYTECFTKEELGKHMGTAERTVAAVTDRGFGEGIIKLLFREDI